MSRHLKAYAVPKSWTLLKKVNKWTARPLPGAHPFEFAMPVSLLLRQLGFAKTLREIKKIVNDKAIMVDGKIVTDHHHSIGFMDVVHIKPKTNLRGSFDRKGRLVFHEIAASETKHKACKVTGKRMVPGGKVQLSLLDGRNLIVQKESFAIGDTVILEVPSQKIIEHLPLAKGHAVFLIGGRHKGNLMKIESVEGNSVRCSNGKDQIDTLKEFVVVVGKDKPLVKV
ncbi:MAG TPA: 30S ribosomal protein S4e [Candidatus Nanoarchaeia archaeon]|nr:30S ribosomal protein S4e [Candidatus Nanoarchaeia archaeon]